MRSQALAVLLGLTVLLAGCLDGADPSLGPTSDEPTTTADAEPSDEPAPGNSTDPGQPDEPAPANGTEPEPDEPPGTSDDPPPSEPAPPQWPALGEATIRPGVQVAVKGSQCTSNFVFTTPDRRVVMLGVAAHCVADGASNNVNGCDEANAPHDIGTQATIEGATKPGALVYSSWATMQANGEDDGDTCAGNDFALIAIHPDDHGRVHPAMLHFGGPTALTNSASAGMGTKVLTYGNSGMRAGLEPTNWHEGYVFMKPSDWLTWTYTASPGIPGDSGSGVLTGDGQALGVISTIQITPVTGSNGVVNLDKALEYAAANGVVVELGTWELLDPGLLPR